MSYLSQFWSRERGIRGLQRMRCGCLSATPRRRHYRREAGTPAPTWVQPCHRQNKSRPSGAGSSRCGAVAGVGWRRRTVEKTSLELARLACRFATNRRASYVTAREGFAGSVCALLDRALWSEVAPRACERSGRRPKTPPPRSWRRPAPIAAQKQVLALPQEARDRDRARTTDPPSPIRLTANAVISRSGPAVPVISPGGCRDYVADRVTPPGGPGPRRVGGRNSSRCTASSIRATPARSQENPGPSVGPVPGRALTAMRQASAARPSRLSRLSNRHRRAAPATRRRFGGPGGVISSILNDSSVASLSGALIFSTPHCRVRW